MDGPIRVAGREVSPLISELLGKIAPGKKTFTKCEVLDLFDVNDNNRVDGDDLRRLLALHHIDARKFDISRTLDGLESPDWVEYYPSTKSYSSQFDRFAKSINSAGCSWQRSWPYMPSATAPRWAIPNSYKYNLSTVFKNDARWQVAYDHFERRLLTPILSYRGKLSNADDIRKCLDLYYGARKEHDYIVTYARLREMTDSNDPKAQEMYKIARSLQINFAKKTVFIDTTLADLMCGEKIDRKDPRLSAYRGHLERIWRLRRHILSEAMEMSQSGQGDNFLMRLNIPINVAQQFYTLQSKMKPPLGDYYSRRGSTDRRTRHLAYSSLVAALKRDGDEYARLLNTVVKEQVGFATRRGYKRASEAALGSEGLAPETYRKTVEAVGKFAKVVHRFNGLKIKTHGKGGKIHVADLPAPMGIKSDVRIPYAGKIIVDAFRPLGPGIVALASKALKPGSGWVDVYPSKGKWFGYYAWSFRGSGKRSFVHINYNNQIASVIELSHELGHALHGSINATANRFQDRGSSKYVSEAFAALCENLVIEHLLEKYKNDDKMRLHILEWRVNRIHTFVYSQAMFSEVEMRTYELYEDKKKAVTANAMNRIYAETLRKYHGPNVILDKDSGVGWARISHLFTSPFYMLSYITGMAAGISLHRRITGGDKTAQQDIMKVLKQPLGTDVVIQMKELGVDLTKAPDVMMAQVAKVMNDTIAEIESLRAKIETKR